MKMFCLSGCWVSMRTWMRCSCSWRWVSNVIFYGNQLVGKLVLDRLLAVENEIQVPAWIWECVSCKINIALQDIKLNRKIQKELLHTFLSVKTGHLITGDCSWGNTLQKLSWFLKRNFYHSKIKGTTVAIV